MTSYFEQSLEHHYQNYLFTHKMYAHSLDLQASLFSAAKEEIDTLVKKFKVTGYPLAELTYYSQIYKNKIDRFYFAHVSPAMCCFFYYLNIKMENTYDSRNTCYETRIYRNCLL